MEEKENMSKAGYIILGLLLCMPFISYLGLAWYKADVVFNQEIGGHMERASNANTIDLAMKEMEIVVANMEKNGYTSGYTSVIYLYIELPMRMSGIGIPT